MKMKWGFAIVGVLIWSLSTNCYSQIIYSQSLTDIDGGAISLSTYQGKKILFLIAPSRLADSSKVDEIATFQAKYPDSVKLIGIMSIEEGYVDSNKVAIKSIYQSRGISIVLTQGMHTSSADSTNQSAIMKWLTRRSLNKRFNEDAAGVGQQFYVNEAGKLYSILVPQTPLISPAVERNLVRKM